MGSNVREYTNDSLNRLKIYSDTLADVIEEYTYDERGNILTVKTRKYGTAASTASTITYVYDDPKYKDRLMEYNDQQLSYGTLGNPTKWANGKSMTWQYGRNLMTVGDNITYAYNADGLRISKSGARNTEYYIVGGKYIGEVTTISGTDYKIAYVYDETDSVIGINVNGNPYYFAKNLQGDVLAILNYQGSVVARYTYDVWGKLIAVKNNDGAAITSNTHVAHLNPFRYRGYMYDKETGFYYLRSRYYDHEVGRFLNGDILVSTNQGLSGFNMFAYCGNNPVIHIDPSGQSYKEFWDAFVQTVKQSNAYFATAVGVSQFDSVLPGPADIVASVMILGGLLACAGIAKHTTTPAPEISLSIPKLETKEDVENIPPPDRDGITYYHSTTLENAILITNSKTLIGCNWEAGHVFV